MESNKPTKETETISSESHTNHDRKCVINKMLKKVNPMGSSFYEQYLNIEGDNLKEVKKVFDDLWDKKIWSEKNDKKENQHRGNI